MVMEVIKSIFEFELLRINDYSLTVFEIALEFGILTFTVCALWLIRKMLFRKNKFHKLDTGNTYALFQIIKYFIWIISIALMLDTIGIKLTFLLAGSAALLVGIGLGLQQTFNDILSGIILLSERSIKVDDILEIDGDVVKIQEIGLRTSRGLNRDDISIIIPNSLITTNKVINWSHQSMSTRFKINVGVAYGSNVDLVVELLEKSALEHPEVHEKKSIEGRLVNFGNSAIEFQVIFFSDNVFRIEKIKSEIRKIINRKFIENNITIPFPQMDLHVKSDDREKY